MFTAQDLRQFYGTENYYKLGKQAFVYTDGIKFIADRGAYWLLSDVYMYQTDPNLKDEPFQSWTLRKEPNGNGELICTDGNDTVLFKTIMEYTDFPLPEITVFVELGSIDGVNEVKVCMLPSER